MNNKTLRVAVLGVTGRHRHQTFSRLLREGQITGNRSNDTDIGFIAGGVDLIGLLGVDQIDVIGLDNNLVIVLEQVNETE